MAKKYLESGCRLFLNGAVLRVGASGTAIDAQIDWDGTVGYCGNDPTKNNHAIGSIVDGERWTYDVYLEIETSRLWFDDEEAH